MKIRLFLLVLFAAICCATATAAPANAVALGLVVDSSSAHSARDGLRVLGATPGSVADRIGFRPGDVLIDANGTSLAGLGADSAGRALAATTFNSIVAGLPASEPLRLRILRGGTALVLNASLQETAAADAPAAATPAADPEGGCGRISTFDVAPRSEQLYHAKILLLDGSTPGPAGVPSFRVAAGTHKLLVAEDIPTLRMGVGDFATLRNRGNTSKELTVTVKPNTTAMLAARLNLGKASDFAKGAYWDPVIWREIPETCR